MTLSRKAKEATKTTLAMTIAYGVGLSMDWDRPYWAGIAVTFVSLGMVGQSINKAALRMSGTVLAMVVALTLVAWFAQDRWLFMLFLSLYLGFCAYMTGGAKHQYFWQVGAFACVIIAFDAGPDPVNAFDTAALRAQQTGLGILVYSLVALLVWPVNSRPAFEAATRDLAATHHRLFNACLGLLEQKGDLAEVKQLSAQEAQQRARFGQLLDAAETDSYEVGESGSLWRRYQRLLTTLRETMGRWRESFADVRAMDLPRLMPGLEAVGAELDGRLAQLELMLAGNSPEQRPGKIDLPLDTNAIGALSHFDQAAITVMRDNILDLERLTRELFEVIDAINGNAEVQRDPKAGRSTTRHVFLPDPDRIGCAIRFMAIVWIAFVALIYVDGLPGGAGFVGMADGIGVALASTPQVPVPMLYAPVAISIALASVLHIFIMPQLSSFASPSLLIFAVTFFFCYVYADPRQMLGRVIGVAMFIAIASISNEQAYSFVSVATMTLMFLSLFSILALTFYFPISWRRERMFLRLLHRYFRSYQYVVILMGRDANRPLTRYGRWRESFHLREVATIPDKLAGWAPHIDSAALAGRPADRLLDLIAGLQELTTRLPAMRDAAGQTYGEVLRQQLQDDVRAWRNGVADILQRVATDPTGGEGSVLCGRLDRFVQRLESRIRETLNGPAAVRLGEREAGQFYRLPGAYRGVSEALVAYTERTGSIDWARWREERF